MSSTLQRQHRWRAVLRSVLWTLIVASGVLGFIGGMGRGPGLLLGAILIAIYDMRRHERVSAPGYVLLILGLMVVVWLWWAVPLL
jgi:ABC-type branched-subunit amino acid transport system permease subunit